MGIATLDQLIEAGVHFGHRASRWNPKMRKFIFGKRNLIHIIDLRETLRGLIRGRHFLQQIAGTGQHILWVGTKRQAREVVTDVAKRTGMPFVAERWIGGTLTNFATIRSRLARLGEVENLFETGEAEVLSKKVRAKLQRERRKMLRNLHGIREMDKLPGVVIVVDPTREHNAVKEAAILKIPVVALIDTDSDPDRADICIPGNDDAYRSIEVLLNTLADGVLEGLKVFQARKLEQAKSQPAPESAAESAKPAAEVTAPAAAAAVAAAPAAKGAATAETKAEPGTMMGDDYVAPADDTDEEAPALAAADDGAEDEDEEE